MGKGRSKRARRRAGDSLRKTEDKGPSANHGSALPPVLFKYFAPSRVDLFATRKVRFSQLEALNDPFEFLVHVDRIALGEAIAPMMADISAETLTEEALKSKLEEVLAENQDYQRLASLIPPHTRNFFQSQIRKRAEAEISHFLPEAKRVFEQVTQTLPNVMADQLESMTASEVVIFSCAENATSVPMWAHYAANHTGFQIGFDPASIFRLRSKKGSPVLPRRVVYSDETPAVGRDLSLVADFVVRKMADWAYEREWRYVWTVQAPEKGALHLVDFDLSAINEVTFGFKADASLERQIRAEFARAQHSCRFYRVSIGREYGLKKELLS